MRYRIAQGKEKFNSVSGLGLIGLLLERSGLKKEIKKAGIGHLREIRGRSKDAKLSVIPR